jgi:hypothetical protein
MLAGSNVWKVKCRQGEGKVKCRQGLMQAESNQKGQLSAETKLGKVK